MIFTEEEKKLFSRLGKRGGKARAQSLGAERRSQIASAGGKAGGRGRTKSSTDVVPDALASPEAAA